MQGSSTPAASFPAPPPPPPPPPRRRNSCCCKVWSFMIMTAIICLGVIIYICIERFTPKRPLFRLDSLSLTNFSASSSSESVTGTWQIGFLVLNANKKKTVNYDALRCSLFYSESDDDDEHGFRLVSDHAPFKQGPISETTLNVTLSALNAHVNDPRVVNGINTEWARDGSVAFNVKVVAHISFQYGSWSFLQDLNILWTKIPVAISSNTSSGNLVGGETRPILEY